MRSLCGWMLLCLAACNNNGTTVVEEEFPEEVTVVNPPVFQPPVLQEFEPAFIGWRFGGVIVCGQFAQPITVAAWEGVTDPCTQRPNEENRVIAIDLSDVVPGMYTIANGCLGPETLVARAVFGIFRGQTLFTLQGQEGQVSLQGRDQNDIVQGTFTIRFQGETSFTSGSFRVPARCL